VTRGIRLLSAAAVLLAGCSGAIPEGARSSAPRPSHPIRGPLSGNAVATCWASEPAPGTREISFSDVTAVRGLLSPLTGMRGHAAAWSDVNGDGWIDLFVGTFADRPAEEYRARGAEGPAPDRLLVGGPDGFGPDRAFPQTFGRTSGVAFADLDEDGDLDLVISRNADPNEGGERPTEILRNDAGAFRIAGDAGLPQGLVGRSVGVLDVDLDGLLDLFIAEDRWSGGSSMLLRNTGGLRFVDATRDAGLPEDVHGLGVGISDLTSDGRADLFVAGSNRLFVAKGDGTFREANGSVFQWETYGEEDDVSGVSIADLNRDGRPELVLGHHYNSTLEFGQAVPIRLYVHRGLDATGDPVFEDVTGRSGLTALPTKAPHVEIIDFDNDGWPDILTTASAADGTRPAIFRHLGLVGDVPRFSTPAGLGDTQYWVTGPTADVDRDGRLDVLLVEWEPALPSLLLRNETASGNWLSVSTAPELGGGIGARVTVYEAGSLGDPGALIGAREIVASHGYAAGTAAVAHFGLGAETVVDVRVALPAGEVIERTGVPANRHLRLPAGCD
jgi:hypothetical protein